MIKASNIVVGYSLTRRATASSASGSLRFAPYPGKCSPEVDLPPLGSGQTPVAGPLSFEYADGECVMLRGRNGSGKTTLMKTIAGILQPLSGTLEIGGVAVLVPTRIPKVKGFTVSDFVRTGMLAESGAFRKLDRGAESRVEEAIRMMELNHLADKDLSRISDGEFQPAYMESVRGATVFLIQSTFPPAENLMELLLCIDAAKRASADARPAPTV